MTEMTLLMSTTYTPRKFSILRANGGQVQKGHGLKGMGVGSEMRIDLHFFQAIGYLLRLRAI